MTSQVAILWPNRPRQIIEVFENRAGIKETKPLRSPQRGHHSERVQRQEFRMIAENIDDPLLDRQLKAF